MAYGTYRPAGGNFTVEMSGNKYFTTLVDNGAHAKEFGDGQDTPLRSDEEPHWSVRPLLVHWSWTDCLCIA